MMASTLGGPGWARMDRLKIGPQVGNLPHNEPFSFGGHGLLGEEFGVFDGGFEAFVDASHPFAEVLLFEFGEDELDHIVQRLNFSFLDFDDVVRRAGADGVADLAFLESEDGILNLRLEGIGAGDQAEIAVGSFGVVVFGILFDELYEVLSGTDAGDQFGGFRKALHIGAVGAAVGSSYSVSGSLSNVRFGGSFWFHRGAEGEHDHFDPGLLKTALIVSVIIVNVLLRGLIGVHYIANFGADQGLLAKLLDLLLPGALLGEVGFIAFRGEKSLLCKTAQEGIGILLEHRDHSGIARFQSCADLARGDGLAIGSGDHCFIGQGGGGLRRLGAEHCPTGGYQNKKFHSGYLFTSDVTQVISFFILPDEVRYSNRKVRSRLLIASFAVLLSSCQNMPEPYAPPVERQPFEDARPHRMSRMVDMSDADSIPHIVADISPGAPAEWRWTLQKPTVKVIASTNQGLRYTIDFSLPEVTFKATGPVTITFFVNDHVLDSVRYTASGEYHYEKAVPADWVEPLKDTVLAAAIDKVWVAPADGAKLGFILTRIGLTQ